MTVFRSIGVPLTRKLCRETTGLRLDDVVRYWYDRYPWDREPMAEVENRVLETVSRLILERGEPMAGVEEAIEMLRAANYELAVASSSPLPLIRSVLEKFGMTACFPVLHSADVEEKGKPDPAVYLSTMRSLGVDPAHCVAFEDSIAGVRAAKAAGAWVIAVPVPTDSSNPGFAAADVVLPSLSDFSMAHVR